MPRTSAPPDAWRTKCCHWRPGRRPCRQLSNMIEASVVIATRNRAAILRECLVCLARQTASGRFDTIVVDNGSSDETQAVLSQAAASGLDVNPVFVEAPNRANARSAG